MEKRDEPISTTEYFMTLMTGLMAKDKSHVSEIFTLLAMVLPEVPEGILRRQYTDSANLFSTFFKDEAVQGAQLRGVITCLGLLLQAQEPTVSAWSRPEVLKMFHLLLSFATHEHPKIRKVGQSTLLEMVQSHHAVGCDALAAHIATFTEKVFAAYTQSDETKTMYLLNFIKSALPYFAAHPANKVVVSILKLVEQDQRTLKLVLLQTLTALVYHEECSLDGNGLQHLLKKLVAADVSFNDPECSIEVIRVLSTSIVKLQNTESVKAQDELPRTFMTVCSFFQAPSSQVHGCASKAIGTIFTNCCTTEIASVHENTLVTSLHSLLVLRYQEAWTSIFPALSKLLLFLGKRSSPLMDVLVTSTVELHESLSSMPQEAKKGVLGAMTETVGASMVAMGAGTFLTLIPLSSTSSGGIMTDERVWLIALLRDHIKQCPSNYLRIFISKMLSIAQACEEASQDKSKTPVERKQLQVKAMQCWSLFPSFCHGVQDLDVEFKGLAKMLANALTDSRYPELQAVVCQGLQSLVATATATCDDDQDVKKQASQQASLAILAKNSKKYLPILITLLESMDSEKKSDRIQMLSDTIRILTTITDATLVNTLFKQVAQKVLEASTSANNETLDKEEKAKSKLAAHLHMSTLLAFVPALSRESIEFLYRVVKPYLLDDTDVVMQKRAYSILVCICETHVEFTTQPIILKDLVESLSDSLLTCSIPAKKMRLKCLFHTVQAMSKRRVEVDIDAMIPELVGEIMLCTKESNGKAREAAFELLIAMAHLVQGDKEENIMKFLQMVWGGLAGTTPHMRSASVVSLSRLVFEFGRTNVHVTNAMPELLKTVLLLLHEKAREVIKAVIGFLKLAIAIIPLEELRAFLPDMITGLLFWIGESKNRFRGKTRILMIKLCRKYGYDAIMELVPEKDRKLITHIKKEKLKLDRQKEKEREARAGAKSSNANKSSFSQFMEEDEEDENFISEEVEGDTIMDFLDPSAVKNYGNKKTDEDDDVDLKVSKDGRLIVPDDVMTFDTDGDNGEDDDKVRNDVAMELKKMGLTSDDKPSKSSYKSKNEMTNQANISRKDKRKREENGKNNGPSSGAGKNYKAKKAGGDVKKKGQLEPYAYLPLDPKHMSKRNKRHAVGQYSSVVKNRRK